MLIARNAKNGIQWLFPSLLNTRSDPVACGQGDILSQKHLGGYSWLHTFGERLRHNAKPLQFVKETGFALKSNFRGGQAIGALIRRGFTEARHFIWNRIIWERDHRYHRVFKVFSVVLPHLGIITIFFFATLLQLASSHGIAAHNQNVALEPKDIVAALDSLDRYSPGLNERQVSVDLAFANHSGVVEKPEIPMTLVASQTNKTSQYLPIQARYQIETGDTISKIAKKFNLHVASVLAANDIPADRAQDLNIGEQLDIPAQDFDTSQGWLDYLNKKQHDEALARQVAQAKQVASQRQRLALVKTAVAADNTVSTGSDSFGRPADGYARNGYHLWAADISGGGRSIVASTDGVVEEADPSGYNGGYGRVIKISHGDGWETLYAHLSQISVSPGERVSRGQQIGVMGATGRVFPAGAVHLHFEIIKNGRRLNPCSLTTMC